MAWQRRLAALTAVKTYTVDPTASQVTWKGYELTGINVTDLKPGCGKEKLGSHLESPGFFGVEMFPAATLSITNVTGRGGGGRLNS